MNSLNNSIKEYTAQLKKGHIQTAYKGIMSFMSELKTYLENGFPYYFASSLYFGYMDMTYFAFTPPLLKEKKLKTAVVYLHGENCFEIWLAAGNRQLQAQYIKMLGGKNIKDYKLSQMQAGVDSVLTYTFAYQPDFDKRAELIKNIALQVIEFSNDIIMLLK